MLWLVLHNPQEVPPPGWGSLRRVRDHPASPLLLLVEKRGLDHVFPISQCLKQRAVGLWALPGADSPPECSQRRFLVAGKDHLLHPQGCGTSDGSPAGPHAAAVGPWSPTVHPISNAPRALILLVLSVGCLSPCAHLKPLLHICCSLLCLLACCLSSWPHMLVDPSV